MKKKISVGDTVRVYKPEWRDAHGREYPAGRHHGKTGTVIEVHESESVGGDYLATVEFSKGDKAAIWVSDIRRTPKSN